MVGDCGCDPLQGVCDEVEGWVGGSVTQTGIVHLEDEFEVGDVGEVWEGDGEGDGVAEGAEGEGVEGVEDGVGFVVEGAGGEEEGGEDVWAAGVNGFGCVEGVVGVEGIVVDFKAELEGEG